MLIVLKLIHLSGFRKPCAQRLTFHFTSYVQGRLEAYLPENKVYLFQRPSHEEWFDRSVPPPRSAPKIFDCSNLQDVHDISTDLPTHGGYHYSSTSVEWYYMLQAMQSYEATGEWTPHVSLQDGIRAVEAGLSATKAIVNED